MRRSRLRPPLYRLDALLVAGIVTTVVRLLLRRARTEPSGLPAGLWERAGVIPLAKTLACSLFAVFDVSPGRKRLAAENRPRLLIVGDLIGRDCPWLPVGPLLEEAHALYAGQEALQFVPVIDDERLLLGEVCREDIAP